MSVESVMPSNHLILCYPLLPPLIFPSIRVFPNESALRIRWPKFWSFSFNLSPSTSDQTTWLASWEICVQVKKQLLELDMKQQTDSKSVKEYVKTVYCHPASLTYIQNTSWEMLGWLKHKLESRLPGEISVTSDMQMTPPLWQKARTKEPLDESERGEWKSWLEAQHSENEDHGIWSHHSMANRWGNSGNSDRLYFWGSKVTADGDCSHEIKRHLLLGRKVMTNLDSILKSRDITLSI